jgi:hypothetical protein
MENAALDRCSLPNREVIDRIGTPNIIGIIVV